MNLHTIVFGEWLPDQMDLRNPGVSRVKNAIPHAMGWQPWPSSEVFSDALTAYCRGTFYARAKDDSVHNYAGDATKLYELSNDTWSDVTRSSGGNYSVSSGERWDFTQWGEKIIAVCGVNQASSNNPQIITMGGSNFADLSGSPPQARCVR